MKLLDLLSKETIIPNLKATTKNEVIEELVDKLMKSGKIKNKQEVLEAILEREKIMSTGIGNGIAIPHGMTDAVDEILAVFGRSAKGIDFEALDDKPAYLFFLLVNPKDMSGPHVKVLAKISRLLKHDYFREALLRADTAEKILEIIEEEERKY
ncbi:MAG TPA: PTS sugar transporter subunit IIA [bacterium]|nr:PTS sugar transporter subunit IIA [bacterium]HOL48514.1 PTS sugar transporter subunit IIA [bacterium]HPQ19051.1 PTS sugar transporter subunit IIA [bacterium]